MTFDAVKFCYPDPDVGEVVAGETIHLEMTNVGLQAHEFEVLDPDGNAVGEVASTDPNAVSSSTITFESPGVYRFHCILIDDNTGKKHSDLGMTGTIDVAPG